MIFSLSQTTPERLPTSSEPQTPPDLPTKSVIDDFNESLDKLNSLQLHDMKEQSRRDVELISQISRQAKNEAESSLVFLKDQLAEELNSMQSEYNSYVQELKKKAEEEQRQAALKLQQERLREQERLKKIEEEKRKAEEEQKRKDAEAKQKAEEEEKKRLAQAKLLEEKKAAEEKRIEEEQKSLEQEQARKSKGMTSQEQVQKMLLTHHDHIKDIKENVVKALDSDKPLKQATSVIKRKINVKLGQLSTSRNQVVSIAGDIQGLVNSVPPKSLQYHWILNFIAKALVSQAETEVTVKASAAIPLAFIAETLLNTYADFDYYLSARLVKKCCFVIGYTGAIDSENGRLRMGWKRGGNEKWEAEVKYEERVAGILSLWAAMTRFFGSKKHPLFNWEAHWQFLARIVNTRDDLLGDVHYVIVSNWWEAAAEGFFKQYGKQAVKLLTLASQEWAAIGVSKKFGAASRLQVLGEDVSSSMNFNSLKNMDP